MAEPPNEKNFTSITNIPYSDLSPLNTLDLHFPTNPAPTTSQNPSIWLIYIHGGAFRDPLVTSASILPTLPHIFPPSSPNHIFPPSSPNHIFPPPTPSPRIHAIASLNYRLSPHPTHPTHPSHPDDPARNATWPDHLHDVEAAIAWVLAHGDAHDPNPNPKSHESEGEGEGESEGECLRRGYILAGHSVGGTMAMKIAQSAHPTSTSLPPPLAIVPLCGIYDFVRLRDAHPGNRELYEAFATAAFGGEEGGGWEEGGRGWAAGDCTKGRIVEGVKVVVVGHGRGDGLVEWGQVEGMRGVLEGVNGDGGKDGEGEEGGKGGRKAVVVEVEGEHNECWEKGEGVARCVEVAVGMLGGLGYL